MNAFEPGGTDFLKYVQQAYVSVLAPVGKGLTVDVGKFVTPAGAEVIENKDNYNYSRGLLFALAIPYYHAGARVGYAVSDTVSLTGYLVNGWNDVKDNNSAKTVIGGAHREADREGDRHRQLHRRQRTGRRCRGRGRAEPVRPGRDLHRDRTG